MKTKQVNIRISTDLIKELDHIAATLHITKAEWIKMQLAEAVHKKKRELK